MRLKASPVNLEHEAMHAKLATSPRRVAPTCGNNRTRGRVQHSFRPSARPPLPHRMHQGMQYVAAAPGSLPPQATDLTFRDASNADMPAISKAVLRESMNPLSLKAECFVVAQREGDKAVQGFGQLAPLGGSAKGGTQRLELRSLVVDPDHRGSGIGQALVAELVRRGDNAEIFLTTLGSTEQFYTPHGFVKLRTGDIPRSLIFEALAGTVVARIVAQQPLIVMRRPPGDSAAG